MIEKQLFENDKAEAEAASAEAAKLLPGGEQLDENGKPLVSVTEKTSSAKGYPLVLYVSRISMFVTAHAHIVGAIISQRDECFSEQVRLLFVVNLRRFKALVSEQFRVVWLAYQGHDPEGYCLNEKCAKRVPTFGELVDNWVGRVLKLIDSDLKTFRSVLETWRPPLPEEAHFYSHETDGRFTTLEMLRRATFNEWFKGIQTDTSRTHTNMCVPDTPRGDGPHVVCIGVVACIDLNALNFEAATS